MVGRVVRVKIERKITRRLGREIRYLREARGWSQEQLAAEADVDNSHLGKLERGEGNPTIELLVRLAMALDSELLVGFRTDKMVTYSVAEV